MVLLAFAIVSAIGVFVFLAAVGFDLKHVTYSARSKNPMLRCPKCWYCMNSINTLCCPECGHCAKSSEDLRKYRIYKRPAWLGSLLVLAGFAGLMYALLTTSDGVKISPSWFLTRMISKNPNSSSVYLEELELRFQKGQLSEGAEGRLANQIARTMGDTNDPEYLAVLASLIESLAELPREASDALAQQLEDESEPSRQLLVAGVMESTFYHHDKVEPALIRMVSNGRYTSSLRDKCALALGNCDSEAAAKALSSYMRSNFDAARPFTNTPRWTSTGLAFIGLCETAQRAIVLEALDQLQRDGITSPDVAIASKIAESYRNQPDPAIQVLLVGFLVHGTAQERGLAAAILIKWKARAASALPALADIVGNEESSEESLYLALAVILAMDTADRSVEIPLQHLESHPSSRIRSMAAAIASRDK